MRLVFLFLIHFGIINFNYGQIERLTSRSVETETHPFGNSHRFNIYGIVNSNTAGHKLVMYNKSNQSIDTLIVRNGKFRISGLCKYPEQYFLEVAGDYYRYGFIVEPGVMILNLDLNKNKITVKGGTENAYDNQLANLNASIYQNAERLYGLMNQAKINGDINCYLSASDSLSIQEEAYLKNLDNTIRHRKTGFYLLQAINAMIIRHGYYEARIKLLDALPSQVRESAQGQDAYKYINQQRFDKENRLNQNAYNFELQDSAGKKFCLNDSKGKYVVLDFWASWCAPCFKEMPMLRNMYKYLDTSKVSFISISVDKDRDGWLKGAQSFRIPWLSLLSDKNTITQYGVKSIPLKILIDDSGKIIASDISLGSLYKRLKPHFETITQNALKTQCEK